jgi:hypothetical protein
MSLGAEAGMNKQAICHYCKALSCRAFQARKKTRHKAGSDIFKACVKATT